MVDVSDKAATQRTARAEGFVAMAPATLALVEKGEAKKGDVLATARIAGIMAAKKTHELIPLCHPLAITKATVDVRDLARARRHPRHGRGQGLRPDRRRDGGADRRLGRLPHHLRHAESRRQSHDARRHPPHREDRRPLRHLSRSGPQGSARRHAAPSPSTKPCARILDGVAPTPARRVAIEAAHGARWPQPLAALLTQPPFDASAMDGYAVRAADVATLPATLAVIGEAAAGHPFAGSVAAGQAVRIFTGAPVPAGADAIVIQENTARDGDKVTVREGASTRATSAPAASISARASRCSPPAAASGPREVVARRRHGPRHAARAPPPARRHPLDRRRAGAARRPSPAPARSSPPIIWAWPRWPKRPAPRPRLLGIARDTRESLDAHFAKAAGRRRHRHHRRRLGRRPRPGRRRCSRRAAWRSASGRSPCGRASR